MDGEMTQLTDPQITTVETIITNDDLESDAVGEVIEAETYTDEFEVSLNHLRKYMEHVIPSQRIAFQVVDVATAI